MNTSTTIPRPTTTVDAALFEAMRSALLAELPLATTTAHTAELEQAVRGARATNDLAGIPGQILVKLQGIRADAGAVAMGADLRSVSLGELKAMAEAMVGDLRVLPATTDRPAVIYRRAYDASGRAGYAIPESWRPIGSADSFYGSAGKPSASNLATPLIYALQKVGQVITQGIRFDCTDGSLSYAYRNREYTQYATCKEGASKLVGEGTGTDDRAAGLTGRLAAQPITEADAEFFKAPMTTTIATGMPITEALAARNKAAAIIKGWTAGGADAYVNLLLACAAPVMQSHPEKSYWLVGQGGTGKSTLAKAVVGLYGGCVGKSIEYLGMPGTTAAEGAMGEIQRSTCVLFDEVEFDRFDRWWAGFKTLTTGLLPFSPRRIGQDASADAACATCAICTSNHLPPIGSASADQRRVRIISMTGAGYDAFMAMEEAGQTWAFALAGATEWVTRRGKHASSSVWVDPEGLSNDEVAVVSAILACEPTKPAPEGYVRAALLPRGVKPKALGLIRKRLKLKSEEGTWQTACCWLPAPAGSPTRSTWEATAAAVKGMDAKDDGGDLPPAPPAGPAPEPTPAPTAPSAVEPDAEDLEGGPCPEELLAMIDAASKPKSFGLPAKLEEAAEELEAAGVRGQIIPCKGGADYSEAKRPTVSWKAAEAKAEAEPDALGVYAPVSTGAAALVLSPRLVAVDLDLPKGKDDGLPSGEKIVSTLMPEAFDAARAVIRTASGGMHIIFDTPKGIELINRAHPGAGKRIDPRLPIYKAGLPIDVRTSKGFVVMAGSEAAGKEWSLVSTTPTPGAPHPMPKSLLSLLDAYGFVKHEDRSAAILRAIAPRGRDPFTGLLSANAGQPDLSPVAEGSRNDTIHAQCYGRHVNHPDECARIDRETMERAAASGLPEDEARSMVRSVHQALGLGA